MSLRQKQLAEWHAAYGSRRPRRPAAGRDSAVSRAFTLFAAAARLVERATRRNGR
jgi:hypothetical protein